MTTDDRDLALGKFTRLSRQIKDEQTKLIADVTAFADRLKESVAPGRDNTVSVLDGDGWNELFDAIVNRSEALSALTAEANIHAGQSGEPPIKVVTYRTNDRLR